MSWVCDERRCVVAEYTLKGDAVVDDAYFEKLAEDAAKGEYPRIPSEWVVRPQSRSKELDGDLTSAVLPHRKCLLRSHGE